MEEEGARMTAFADHCLLSPEAHKGCHCAVESLMKLELYMYFAVKDRDLVRFSRLLATGLGPEHCFSEAVPGDAHHTTLLQLAVQENFVDAVEILLMRATPGDSGHIQEINIQTSLMYAMKYNMIEVIRVFLKAAISEHIFLDPSTTFRHAMYKGQYDLVREVIKKPKFDVNLEATWGMDRPLHIAVHHNQVELVEQLLQLGAVVDAEDRKGTTPLVVACSLGFVACTEVLLQHGADPNYLATRHTFSTTQTPLKSVLRSAKNSETTLQLLRLLLAAGLDLRKDQWLLTGPANKNLNKDIFRWLEDLCLEPLSLKQQGFTAIRKLLMHNTAGVHYVKALELLPIAPGLRNYLNMKPAHL